METLVALSVVALALAYLAARLITVARGNRCGGGCGATRGCPVVKEALRVSASPRRP